MYRFSVCLCLLLLAFSSARGQQPFSVDLTIGVSGGAGGRRHYVDDGAIAGDALLAYRTRPTHGFSRVAAVNVGRRSVFTGHGDVCRIELGSTGCLPSFPSMSHAATLGGLELSGAHSSLRGLVGPGVYSGGTGAGLGAQMRLEGSIGWTHVAFTGMIQRSWLSLFDGESFRFRSTQFGFRFR